MQAYWLSYDFPVRSNLGNPSRFLRRRAVRVQLSMWIILEEQIPWTAINDWIAAGCTVDTLKFDAAEGEKIIQIVAAAIRKQAADAAKKAERSIQYAENQMTESDKGPTAAHEQFDKAVIRIVKRAESLIGDLGAAARIFNLDVDGLPLDTARNTVMAMRSAAENRAKVYVEMARAAATMGADGVFASQEAQADHLEPAALADIVDVNGGDSSSLREAFGV